MRILHIAKFYPPIHGGMETVVESMAEGLVRQGHEVTVLCAHSKAETETEKRNGVFVVRLSTPVTLLSQPLTWSLPLHLLLRIRQFEVIHLHSPNPLAEFLCWLFVPGKKLVYTYHADIVRQKKLVPLYRVLVRAVARKARAVTASSPQLIKSSTFLQRLEKLVTVLPFGIDGRRFNTPPKVLEAGEALRAKYGAYTVFVGRLVGYKGLTHLVSAARDTPMNVVIVGEGPLLSELQQQAANEKVSHRVHFMGRIDDNNELLAILAGAACFTLPSITPAEAFGMVLVEALAMGLPLVTTRLGTGVEFVNADSVTGIHVEAGDASALASALNKILSDGDLHERFAKDARKRFEENFEAGVMVSRLVKLYQSK